MSWESVLKISGRHFHDFPVMHQTLDNILPIIEGPKGFILSVDNIHKIIKEFRKVAKEMNGRATPIGRWMSVETKKGLLPVTIRIANVLRAKGYSSKKTSMGIKGTKGMTQSVSRWSK